MKIGDAGEAFFVFETEGDVPDDLITSPLLEATRPSESSTEAQAAASTGLPKHVNKLGAHMQENTAASQEPDFLDLDASSPTKSGSMTSPPKRTSASMHGRLETKISTPSLLPHTVGAGKVAVTAAVEANREEQAQVKDISAAAGNIFESVGNGLVHQGLGVLGDIEDETLPKVSLEDTQTPEIIDHGGAWTLRLVR